MKNNYCLLFFFAYWDGSTKTRNNFIEKCKELGVRYEIIDVETEKGLEIANHFNIKMCPRIVLLSNHKHIATFNGTNSLDEIESALK